MNLTKKKLTALVSATGGTITTSGLYTIHSFTSSGTFTVISGITTASPTDTAIALNGV